MAHPTSMADHELNRSKVCAPCGIKVTSKTGRSISEGMCLLIKEKINPDFDLSDSHFPLSICNTCRVYLSGKGKSTTVPTMPNYQDVSLLKNTRASENQTCNCYICITGKATHFRATVAKKIGVKRSLSPELKVGLEAVKEPLISKELSDPKKSKISTCPKCWLEIGKGIRHDCKVTKVSENVLNSIQSLPDKVQDQIATTLLMKKAEETVGTTDNAMLKLATKGRTARVVLNPAPLQEPTLVSHEKLDELQSGLGNLSNTAMKGTANWVRTVLGRASIPPGYKNHLAEETSKLDDVYHIKEGIVFDIDGGKQAERPVIYANCEEILDRVINERGYIGSPNVIVLADGGGGFLKFCMTVLPEDHAWDNDDEEEMISAMENMESPVKSKFGHSSYAEGGTMKKGKLTGVKRVIPLAFVPDIKESHDNLKVIVDLIGLNNIPFHIVCDYKFALLCAGCQTATASYPCPYCFVSLQELARKELEIKPERTFGDLDNDHKKYLEESKGCKSVSLAKKKAQLCHSTVNESLLQEDSCLRVLEKYILPELHSILGFVNHLFFDGLCKVLPKEQALLWPKKLNLVPKGYHGTTLEGNACRHLVSKGDALLDPEILGEVPAEAIQPFIKALKCFDKLVVGCFSSKIVRVDVPALLSEFKEAYLETNLTVTLKIHAVFDHLVPTLNLPYFNGRGLGVCTEQAGESIHSHFSEHFWKKWKLSSMDHPEYANNLKRAVVECASKAL